MTTTSKHKIQRCTETGGLMIFKNGKLHAETAFPASEEDKKTYHNVIALRVARKITSPVDILNAILNDLGV